MYVAASQLALSFALPSPTPPPPPPYRRLSYVVFVVGTIEDCIRGVQNFVSLFKAFRSWGTRRTPLSERRLAAYKKKKKKKRGRFLLLIWGAGVSEKLNVQFSFQPPNPPPPPHFLFRSATAGKSICSFEQFFFLQKKVKSRWVPLNPSCWYKS